MLLLPAIQFGEADVGMGEVARAGETNAVAGFVAAVLDQRRQAVDIVRPDPRQRFMRQQDLT